MKKWSLYVVVGVVIGALGVYSWLGSEIQQGQKPVADGTNDYLIILGAKVKPGGVPSLSLKNRLDVAIDYLTDHPHVQVIVSGGQGMDEEQTEASLMYDYLVDRGIVAERILIEDRSTSTYENLAFSKVLLPDNVSAITIVSNNFHLHRASYLAHTLGLESDVVAAPTPKSVRLKSGIRERLALLKTYLLGS
ncbi:YdcF family protein [Solibacillus sp. FSL H8-0538]|uniref:YdcF family protein n=1 Tax=Solibacillus sp. FSL H8-0538 TaxID=2921400 RepID=UPI0030F848D6